MKTKQIVKLGAAVLAGTAMLGATVAGAAFAADLGSFPSKYVQNGQFDGKIVVGADASASDTVAAIGIAAALGRASAYSMPAQAVASFSGVSGDVSFDELLTSANGIVNPLKSSKFSALGEWVGDNELKYKDSSDSIKAHQEIILNGIKVGRGLETDDRGQWKVYAPSDSVQFKMVFDEAYDQSKGSIDLPIFNKELTLKGYSANSLILSTGSKHAVSLDDPTFVDEETGATVTFKGISQSGDSVFLTVTNAGLTDTAVLSQGVEKSVAGVSVMVDEVFRLTDVTMFATVHVGSKLSKTVNTNDKMPGSDEWVLSTVNVDSNGLLDFVVQYAPESASSLGAGQAISGLYDGFKITNKGFTLPESHFYNGLTFEQKGSQNVFALCGSNPATATKAAIKISWPKAYTAQVGGVDVTDAYLYSDSGTNTIVSYHLLSDGTYKCQDFDTGAGATLLTLNYDGSTEVKVKYTQSQNKIEVDTNGVPTPLAAEQPVKFAVTDVSGVGFTAIGQGTGSDPISTDLQYGSEELGTKEYDYFTHYGVKISNPSQTLENGKVVLGIPGEQNKVSVSIGQDAPVTTTTVAASMPVMAVLDTDVVDPLAQDLILVGGPTVNKLVKALGGSYAERDFYAGAGKLLFVERAFGGPHDAIVVAGWDADDTRAAAHLLENYGVESLAGKTSVVVHTG